VAIALGEAGARGQMSRQETFDLLVSSNLLEAELLSALARERVKIEPQNLLSRITWVHPTRALTELFQIVLSAGYQKGADLWHLACALHAFPEGNATFLTLDQRQRQAAARLGFST
jgi:hypothetical protein